MRLYIFFWILFYQVIWRILFHSISFFYSHLFDLLSYKKVVVDFSLIFLLNKSENVLQKLQQSILPIHDSHNFPILLVLRRCHLGHTHLSLGLLRYRYIYLVTLVWSLLRFCQWIASLTQVRHFRFIIRLCLLLKQVYIMYIWLSNVNFNLCLRLVLAFIHIKKIHLHSYIDLVLSYRSRVNYYMWMLACPIIIRFHAHFISIFLFDFLIISFFALTSFPSII